MAQFEAKEIGARIALARREAGLTQEQLAELAPFSTRSLQNYERGEVIPYRQMRELSKILGRPVEWFLRGDDEEEQTTLERLAAIEDLLAGIDAKLSLLVPAEQLANLEVARAEAAAALELLEEPASSVEVRARRA